MPQYYLNRNWVDTESPQISLHEAGFVRGDGVFETLLVENGSVFRLGDHLDRLLDGAEKIRVQSDESREEIAELIREYTSRNELRHAVVRIIITRGIYRDMPWSYTGPNSLYITHTDPPDIPEVPVRVVYLDETKYPLIRHHPAVKSLNYLGNMLAKMDANEAGAFEPVLYNAGKYITEGGIRNVFFVKDRKLLTPPLSLGILPGTMRDAVIDIARGAGIEVQEELIPLGQVDEMDEAFLTSTAVKILPMTWDRWNSNYELTTELRKILSRYIVNPSTER